MGTVIVALPDLLMTDPVPQPRMMPLRTTSSIGTVEVLVIFWGGFVGTVTVAVKVNVPVYVPSKSVIGVAEFAFGRRSPVLLSKIRRAIARDFLGDVSAIFGIMTMPPKSVLTLL